MTGEKPMDKEQEAQPIDCKKTCASYDKCKPFVNPIICTNTERKPISQMFTEPLLLSDAEINDAYCEGLSDTTDKRTHGMQYVAKAQLAKAEPLIRADERKRMGEWLDNKRKGNDPSDYEQDSTMVDAEEIAKLKQGKTPGYHNQRRKLQCVSE